MCCGAETCITQNNTEEMELQFHLFIKLPLLAPCTQKHMQLVFIVLVLIRELKWLLQNIAPFIKAASLNAAGTQKNQVIWDVVLILCT